MGRDPVRAQQRDGEYTPEIWPEEVHPEIPRVYALPPTWVSEELRPAPKRLRCKKRFRRQRAKGKARCVTVHRKHRQASAKGR